MRTPAGKECRFYYSDYFRGRETQECRLIERNPQGGQWHAKLCNGCPVPDILRQNACPNLVLEGRVEKTFLGLREPIWAAQRFECRDQLDKHENADNRRTIFSLTLNPTCPGIPDHFIPR